MQDYKPSVNTLGAFYFGITCVYPPTTFEIDTDGIEKLDDWQIIFEPQIAFALQIPK